MLEVLEVFVPYFAVDKLEFGANATWYKSFKK
jgi:hypothetical protein